MCDMRSASFKLLNTTSYIPRVALVNIGERGNSSRLGRLPEKKRIGKCLVWVA
jgi:hypothetical protein